MPKRSLFGLFTLILALLVGFTAPAAAEFFGCSNQRSQVYYSSDSPRWSSNSRYTHEYSAHATRKHYRHTSTRYYSRRSYDYSNDRWR